MKRRERLKKFLNYQPSEQESWYKFIKACKIPGLKDALQYKLHVIKRILWVIFVFMGLGLAVWSIIDSTMKYMENRVLHSFESKNILVNNTPFPAVSVNKLNSFRTSKLIKAREIFNQAFRLGEAELDGTEWTLDEAELLMYVVHDVCTTESSLSSWYKATESVFKGPVLKHIFVKNNKTFTDDLGKTAFRKIIQFMNEGMGDCLDMVKACAWNGIPVNCNEVFTATQTKLGRSCIFNGKPNALRRRNETLQTEMDGQKLSKEKLWLWGNYSLDKDTFKGGTNTEYGTSTNRYKTGNVPLFQKNAGQPFGLTFIVVVDDEDEMACTQHDGVGYRISIHPSSDEPDVSLTGSGLPPNHEVFIKIEPQITIADESIRSINKEERGCIFLDEADVLKHFKEYTQANCRSECLAEETFKKCECATLTMPKFPGAKLCKPADEECLRQTAEELIENGKFCSKCQPSCTEIKYRKSISMIPYSELSPPPILEHLGITKRTVIVHVFFGSPSVVAQLRSIGMTFTQSIAEFGGILGLTNGLSLVDAARIFAALWAVCLPVRVLKLIKKYIEQEEINNEQQGLNEIPQPRGQRLRLKCKRLRSALKRPKKATKVTRPVLKVPKSRLIKVKPAPPKSVFVISTVNPATSQISHSAPEIKIIDI